MTKLGYTLVLVLDAASATVIDEIDWQIATARGLPPLYGGEVRPHVTLGIFERIDLGATTKAMDGFAARTPAIPVTYGSLGVFLLDTAVVFAAPVVTRELLSYHASLYEDLSAASTGPYWPYAPGNWVPHTTLAAEITADSLQQVLAVSCRLSLPFTGHLDRLLLARFPTGPVLHSVMLG